MTRTTFLRTLYFVLCAVALAFSACRSVDSCLDMPSHTFSDGEFTFAKYGGYSWGLLPSNGPVAAYRYEFMLVDAEDRHLPKIVDLLTADLGEPVAHNSIPTMALSQVYSNTSVFGFFGSRPLPEDENLYWWITPSHVVRLYLCPHKDMPETPAFVLLSLYDLKALP